MTNQNHIDAFVEQAKARLDEMGAAAKSLELQIGEVDSQMRPEAERTLARIKGWVSEGETKLSELREKGENHSAEAQAVLSRLWSEFETEISRWVEITNSQHATFDAQARAQLASWQGMVDGFVQMASQTREAGKATTMAELERLKQEAKRAEARLDAMKSAGDASWAIMSKGLEDSRASFEKAALQAWIEFGSAANK